MKSTTLFRLAGPLSLLGTLAAQGGGGPQASLSLGGCDVAICNSSNTEWTISKNGRYVPKAGAVSWTVQVQRGTTSAPVITVHGYQTITNTGTADATLGNIVVNLQVRQNNQWVTAASDVADGSNSDGSTSAIICNGASSEGLSAFSEGSGSGSLDFYDVNNNTAWALVPPKVIVPTATVNLLYSATFNNKTLGISDNDQIRIEFIITFGNVGPRGGSGASCSGLDINGSGGIDPDELFVRSVPCRVSRNLPPLEQCNDTVTLTDTSSSITTSGTVTFNNFATNIGGGSGVQVLNASGSFAVSASVDPGLNGGTITNCARLTGASSNVVLNAGSQQFTFPCCVGVNLPACAEVPIGTPPRPNGWCSYTQGGFQGGGVPGQLFANNFVPVFTASPYNGQFLIGTLAGNSAIWTADNTTGKPALKTYLAGGGPSGPLTADTVNAMTTSGGTLAKQVAALTLNVAFSDASLTPGGFGNLRLCGTGGSLQGQRVRDILVVANNALGNGTFPALYNAGALNDLITALNESWDNCVAGSFATKLLAVSVCP